MGTRRSNVNSWVNEETDPAADAVLEIRDGLKKINPDAAEDLIGLYLGDRTGESDSPSGVAEVGLTRSRCLCYRLPTVRSHLGG